MNYFAFSGLVTGLITFLCGAIVLFYGINKFKNRLFFVYCLSIATWGMFFYFWQESDSNELALFHLRSLLLGACWIPALGFHFIMHSFDLLKGWKKKLLMFEYGLAIFLSGVAYTPFTAHSIISTDLIRYWGTPGPLFHLHIANFSFVYLLMSFLMFKAAKNKPAPVKKEIHVIGGAFTVAYSFGSLNFPYWYGIPILPWFNLAIPIAFVVMTCYILKSQLIAMSGPLKKFSIYSIIYSSLLALSLPAILPATEFLFSKYPDHPTIAIYFLGISLGVFLSLGPLIYAYLINNSFWLRSHLTAGLTHELKSPISSIQGALEIVNEQLSSPESSKSDALQHISLIRKNTDRLDGFVKNLLHVAKTEGKDVEIEKEQVSFNELVHTSIDTNKPAAQSRGIEFHFIPNGIGKIDADKEKIQQALSNIVHNAVKFSDGGQISINLSHKDNQTVCRIQDEGHGISSRDLPRIFDRFYQGKNSKGSGIGLTIAKTWIEAHGGKIWAESEGEGRGTAVVFTLPLGKI